MKRLVFTAALFAALVFSASAYAQAPDLHCWIESSDFTAPSIEEVTDGSTISTILVHGDTTEEYLDLYYRNKGDADATDVECHLYNPEHATLTSGDSIRVLGTVAVPDNDPSSLSFEYEVGLDAKPYSKMKWEAECSFSDGTTAVFTTACMKKVKVRPRLERTIIDTHRGPVSIHPSTKKAAYTENSDLQTYIYDMVSGETTQLTFDTGNYMDRPMFSPNGKKLAVQQWDGNTSTTWIMNIDGTEATPLYGRTNDGHHDAWSWKGDLLYMHHCGASSLRDKYTLTIEGGTYEIFLDSGSDSYQPGMDVYKDLLVVRNRTTKYLEIFDKDGSFLDTLDFFDNTADGEFKPGSSPAKLLFRAVYDCNNNSQLFTINKNQENPTCLTCLKSATEYQLSSDADTIFLDHEGVIKIKGVWKDGDVGGKNYWTGNTAEAPYDPPLDNEITLPEPLSDVPGDQVAVRVTYWYLPYYCNSKAHYNKAGNAIAFKSLEPDYNSIWAMRANGDKRIRLTFNDGDDQGYSKSLPRIVKGGNYVLFSSYAYGSSHLTMLKLDWKTKLALGLRSKDDDDDDDSICGMVSNRPNPLGFVVVLLPVAALYLLRRRAMVR